MKLVFFSSAEAMFLCRRRTFVFSFFKPLLLAFPQPSPRPVPSETERLITEGSEWRQVESSIEYRPKAQKFAGRRTRNT